MLLKIQIQLDPNITNIDFFLKSIWQYEPPNSYKKNFQLDNATFFQVNDVFIYTWIFLINNS